jgi:hypothetical protein
MGVGGSFPVAREVLRSCQNPGILEAAKGGQAHSGYNLRVVAVRAVADDGVCGIGADVEHRGEVPIDPGDREFSSRGARQFFREAWIAESPEEARCRWNEEGGRKSRDPAAFLIHPDQERSRR